LPAKAISWIDTNPRTVINLD